MNKKQHQTLDRMKKLEEKLNLDKQEAKKYREFIYRFTSPYPQSKQKYKQILTELFKYDNFGNEFCLMSNIHADGEDGLGACIVHKDYERIFSQTDDYNWCFDLSDINIIKQGFSNMEIDINEFPDPFKKTLWHLAYERDTERLIGLIGESKLYIFFGREKEWKDFIFIKCSLGEAIKEIYER